MIACGKEIKMKIITFYLPQFHEIPENNEWWGKGFTEWSNVGKPKHLAKGHTHTLAARDLVYYDLQNSVANGFHE